MTKKGHDPDAIYRYLGFEVHPGKIREFWNSEDEKKNHVKKVQALGKKMSVLERESSLKNANLMTSTDKAFSIIGGVILIIAFFLPVYSFDAGGNSISGSAISYFLNLSFLGGYSLYGGLPMILALVIFSLVLVSCPVAGVLNILAIFNKNKGERYLETVKRYSRFNFIPILLYFLLFAVLIVGAAHPFGSLGIGAMGNHLGFGAVFSMTSYGFWLNIVGLLFGFAQARGI